MARSTLVGHIERLLSARGWDCEAKRFTLATTEPALEPIRHVWMAGEAQKMTQGEVMQVRPTRIIVQDAASTAEIERLESALAATNREPNVVTFTRFIDVLWDASKAAARARQDAQLQDKLLDAFSIQDTPDARHAPQRVTLGGVEVSDHRLLDKAIPAEGSWLAILADAGLGKSEMMQWHEWRYAVFYESAYAQGAKTLPPIAVRVPLRGLRVLSLDAIAHYLSRPDTDEGLPALTRVDTGGCLLELLRMQRIILLLDGVDELMISREKLEDGLRELKKAVDDSGRIVVAGRVGHLTSSRAVTGGFTKDEIARIEPMPPDGGRALLTRYGAPEQKAHEIVGHLNSSPAQGIPLFLLMAYNVDLSSPLQPLVLQSRTKVLEELLRLFCERDEPRLGVSTEDQLRILTDFAHWTGLEGELEAQRALELLGVDPSESAAALLLNPHALLTRTPGDSVHFKYPNFYHFFLARALTHDWADLGFMSILEDLRSRKLEEETIEYFARLVDEAELSDAWALSGTREDLRKMPLVRRNLLAVLLARLEDDLPGGTPTARSSRLAAMLGGRRLEDVSLSDLSLVRLDFADWTLARLHGRGGSIQYCTNLNKCQFDESIQTLDSLDGTEIPVAVEENALLDGGRARLRQMLRQVRRKGSPGLVRILGLEETIDKDGWRMLRRAGFATIEKRAGSGKFWVLTTSGMQVLRNFISADAKNSRALQKLISTEPELRDLLLRLSAK